MEPGLGCPFTRRGQGFKQTLCKVHGQVIKFSTCMILSPGLQCKCKCSSKVNWIARTLPHQIRAPCCPPSRGQPWQKKIPYKRLRQFSYTNKLKVTYHFWAFKISHHWLNHSHWYTLTMNPTSRPWERAAVDKAVAQARGLSVWETHS